MSPAPGTPAPGTPATAPRGAAAPGAAEGTPNEPGSRRGPRRAGEGPRDLPSRAGAPDGATSPRAAAPGAAAPGAAAPARSGEAQPPASPDGRRPPERADRGDGGRDRDRGRGGAAAAAAVGFVGGFMAASGARRMEDIRQEREERDEDGYRVIREPGRAIVRTRDGVYVVHDDTERFRALYPGARVERRGREVYTYASRPNGDQIIIVTDPNGRLLRRIRRARDGRQVVLIDNGRPRSYEEDIVELPPPPPMRIPRDRYVVMADDADESLIYDTLVAPPVAPLPQRYTLDQVRYSPTLRARMRSVDLDTINFDSGTWEVASDQAGRLSVIANALKQAIRRNPNEVFLIEGYTDAVGNDVDNLSLSDRRAQSVASVLSANFQVPPENLTTQGYGKQYLKVQTTEASRANRRVTIRRITPLLAAQTAQRDD